MEFMKTRGILTHVINSKGAVFSAKFIVLFQCCSFSIQSYFSRCCVPLYCVEHDIVALCDMAISKLRTSAT